jgi:Zn-dependent protease with chaperone function
MAKLGGASDADPWKKFTSTHPDPLDRAERLRALIPTIVAEERAK